MKNATIARLTAGTAALAAAATGTLLAVSPAEAAPARPDTDCMRAGITTLKSVGLFSTVARDGLSIADATSFGVTVREGADLTGVPDPLPLSVVLADHRAGDSSLFVYPWCD